MARNAEEKNLLIKALQIRQAEGIAHTNAEQQVQLSLCEAYLAVFQDMMHSSFEQNQVGGKVKPNECMCEMENVYPADQKERGSL